MSTSPAMSTCFSRISHEQQEEGRLARPSSHARDKPPIIRRAELRSAVYRDERRWTEAELEMVLAGREVMLAEASLAGGIRQRRINSMRRLSS